VCRFIVANGRSLYRTPPRRRLDVLEFGEMVVADAHRIHADRLG